MSSAGKRSLGRIGEEIVCRYLSGRLGHIVLTRNYTIWGGEIDVISKFHGKLHFVEVKTVTRETSKRCRVDVIHETNRWRPEELMSRSKIRKISRAVKRYLMETQNGEEIEWQIDLVVVYLDRKTKMSFIKVIKDIVVEE